MKYKKAALSENVILSEKSDGIYKFRCAGVSRIAWFFADSQQTVIICVIGFEKPPSNRAYRPIVDRAKIIRTWFFDEMSEEDIDDLRP